MKTTTRLVVIRMTYNDKQWSVYKGNRLTVEVFGASHAPEIGVKIDGLKGEKVDLDKLQKFLDRRRARKTAYSTKRLEGDQIIVESGLENNQFTDKQFKAVIKNTSQRSVLRCAKDAFI